jgi:hypothetical protein
MLKTFVQEIAMTVKRFIPMAVAGLLVAFLLVFSACSKKSSTPTSAGSTVVQLSLTGLKPVGDGLNYQAWAIESSGGYYYGHPLGIFNANENGQMISTVGDTLLSGEFTANLAPEFVYGIAISLEPSKTIVTTSSYMHLLGGIIADGKTNLTVDSPLGMYANFTTASGRYVLATPTDSVSGDENSGLWFMDLSTGISLNGLSLPALPSGWAYEGWVRINNIYVPTGKFTSANAADDANKYGSTWSSPAYPGEDFLLNPPTGLSFPTDLSGQYVMVTVEPAGTYVSNPTGPSPFRILQANITSNAESHVTYYMNSVVGGLPSGTAAFK